MLVIVLGEHVEVIGVEGDVEVVVVAGLYLSHEVVALVLQRTELELVLRHDVFTGEVGIGGLILVVDIVGTLEGVLVCRGHYCRVYVGVGNELTTGIEHNILYVAISVIEFYSCHLDVAYLVIAFCYLEVEAEQGFGVVEGDLHVALVGTGLFADVTFAGSAGEDIAIVYGG